MTTTVTTVGNGSYRRVRWNQPGGTLRDDVTYNVASCTRYDVTKPDRVRTRKPTGWLMPKGYQSSLSSAAKPLGEMWLRDTQGRLTSYWSGYIPGSYSNHETMFQIPYPPDALNRCVISALLKLKDTRINIGVALGEASSTAASLGDGWGKIRSAANTVGNGLTRLARAGRAFKKGKWKESCRHLRVPPPKAVPKEWLALQYGWLPLMSDIKGAIDELEGLPAYRLVKTVKSSLRAVKDEEVYVPLAGKGMNIHRRKAVSGLFLRLDYEPSNTFVQAATRVGLTNPLEVAWELVPFSFVLDWALPIGDWLSALDATLGWDFKSGSASYLSRNKCGIRFGYSTSLYTGSWSGSFTELDFKREVISSSPFPMPPEFKNPLSVGHAANGFALLATVFGK